MSEYSYVAPCLMGVEGLVADELRAQDLQNVRSENGRVFFTGDESAMARANAREARSIRSMEAIGSFFMVSASSCLMLVVGNIFIIGLS